jgi:membrane protease YdiL (CAAX protease family)
MVDEKDSVQPLLTTTQEDAPAISWGTRYALLGVGCIFILLALLLLPISLFSLNPEHWSTIAWAQMATGLSFILIPYALVKRRGGGWRDLGFRSFSLLSSLRWVSVALIIYIVFLTIYTLVFPEAKQEEIQDSFGPLTLQIFFIVLLAPLSEEICFRGFLFRGFRKNISFLPAALISGFIFGILHLSGGFGTVPAITLLGTLFALLYEKTNSIWPAIILHTLNNAFVLTILTIS